MMAILTGENFVGGLRCGGLESFNAVDARSGEVLEPAFAVASPEDVERACTAAARAQSEYANRPLAERAAFLRAIADRIDVLGDVLTRRAMAESGLPEARLNGERGRTVGQLRLFAAAVEAGAWQEIRIDPADASRVPPKPDLRMRKIPLGPVAVFGASNFPLAFSVGGGDTAAALAAGCVVVVKGHPAHPGTSELVAGAIAEAVRDCGMPGGVFSLLNGPGNTLGEALVTDPRIAAVGFTGSRGGGLALMRHAASRAVPIPVYAEMSSINPVVLLPSRLESAAEELGAGHAGSLALGAGQFCTNPGIVLGIAGAGLDRFLAASAEGVAGTGGQTMLTKHIREAFVRGSARLGALPGAELVAEGRAGSDTGGQAGLYAVDAATFMAEPAYADEIFGPSSIVVRCRDEAEMGEVLAGLEGQLTATLHFDAADEPVAARLLPLLEGKVGRIIANGWPTGVEVSPAMVHGGPFPATSDGRSTSVGTLAIDRFLRPVCYQDLPDSLLPEALRRA